MLGRRKYREELICCMLDWALIDICCMLVWALIVVKGCLPVGVGWLDFLPQFLLKLISSVGRGRNVGRFGISTKSCWLVCSPCLTVLGKSFELLERCYKRRDVLKHIEPVALAELNAQSQFRQTVAWRA